MPSLPVPFPDSTMPGTHSQESGGRIINSYVEPLAPTAPTQIIYRRAPGLRNFGTTVRTGFRGAIEVNNTLYCAFANRLVTLNAAGSHASKRVTPASELWNSGAPDVTFMSVSGT